MAATRRYRVSDTNTGKTNTYCSHRSMSHNTSTVVENADNIQVQQPAFDVAESADEGSQRSSPPMNRSVKGYCRNCRNPIGDFYNSWYRVTGTYYVPVLLGSYSVTLKSTGNTRAASNGTDLEGCFIQPLSCPHPDCGESPIGFIVVTAPTDKGSFLGRDFFKLSRIELQCEIAPNQFIVVEPQEDPAPDLLVAEDTSSPSSSNRSPRAFSIEAMEVNPGTPYQKPGYPRMQLEKCRYEKLSQGEQQPPYPIESDGRPLKASPASMHSPSATRPLQSFVQKARGNTMSSPSLATETICENKTPQREPAIHSTGILPESRSIFPQSQSPIKTPGTNGHQYPKAPVKVSVDDIDRFQTEFSQNSGTLTAHTRDIRHGEESFQQLEETLRREFQTQLFRQSADIQKVEEAVVRLHHEMQSMRHAIDSISRELQASRTDQQSHGSHLLPCQKLSAQDSALELMAQQIATMSHKTSEVEILKLHIEIMKNKIYRLEGGSASGHSQVTSQMYQSPREMAVQFAQSTQAAGPSHHGMSQDIDVPHSGLNIQHHPPAFGASSSKVTLEATQRTEPPSSQSSSWTTINAGVKRNPHNGLESSQEATMYTSKSPKRQRLGDTENQIGPTASQLPPSHTEADAAGPRSATPARTVSPQHTISEAIQSSQPQQPPYFPFTTEHRPLDDSWRSEGKRIIEHQPRGRGRGRGPGSRGGRVRKSMPAQLHSTLIPHWEEDDWQNVVGSQTGPDSFSAYIARTRRGGIVRRGSGGGGRRGEYASSDRATSLGLQGVTAAMSFGSPSDSYNPAKRTRTKPTRNADGVLIRKDGRPDMRSQSSAANLRKVHAQKDGESSHSPTPTTLRYATSADAPDAPSPNGYAADPDVTDKHNVIMSKMFPAGVHASRKQHDYARQVFAEDGEHSVHTRTHSHHSATKTPTQVKKEQVQQDQLHVVQIPGGQDVHMDRVDDAADDEH